MAALIILLCYFVPDLEQPAKGRGRIELLDFGVAAVFDKSVIVGEALFNAVHVHFDHGDQILGEGPRPEVDTSEDGLATGYKRAHFNYFLEEQACLRGFGRNLEQLTVPQQVQGHAHPQAVNEVEGFSHLYGLDAAHSFVGAHRVVVVLNQNEGLRVDLALHLF